MLEAQWLDVDPATLAGRNSHTVAGAAPEWTQQASLCVAPDSRFNCRHHAGSHLRPGHLSRSAASFICAASPPPVFDAILPPRSSPHACSAALPRRSNAQRRALPLHDDRTEGPPGHEHFDLSGTTARAERCVRRCHRGSGRMPDQLAKRHLNNDAKVRTYRRNEATRQISYRECRTDKIVPRPSRTARSNEVQLPFFQRAFLKKLQERIRWKIVTTSKPSTA